MALCSGSTAPGACAQKVLPGPRKRHSCSSVSISQAGLRHAQARAEFSHSTADHHGTAYTSHRTRGQRTLRGYAPEEPCQSRDRQPLPARCPNGYLLYQCFRIPSADRGVLRSGSQSPRRQVAGFELQAIAHAARVIFEDLTRGSTEGSSHRRGSSHDRRSPSAWCPRLCSSKCSGTTPRRSRG